MVIRKCEMCGMEFQANSNRAKYCKYCRDKAQVQRNRAYKEKKDSGTAVKIGSEQVCPLCGKPYIVTSGSQKYCRDCTPQRKKAPPNTEYLKEKYDYIRVNVPKGEREKIKAYAESQGMSVNKLLLTALEEYRKNKKGE